MDIKSPVIEPLAREKRLYERVADKILTLIKNDTWQPGDRLPPERELADAFGVSRTVVREAIKVLEAQGVLETVTGSGVYVRPPDSSVVSRSLQTYIQLLDQDDIDLRLAEIRRVLEVEIAALAAERAAPEQQVELQQLCRDMRQQADSAQALAELDLRFHLLLADATQNQLFRILLTPLIEQVVTLPNLRIAGLMTMAPLTDDQQICRFCFARCRELFQEVQAEKIAGPYFRHLSMGMSQDYVTAVEQRATMVRIGTALFE